MGSLYKIIAEVLASRLSLVIASVIGQTQFAFIKGRQILDCSLLANEVIDNLRRKKSKGIIFKVDFEKAYNNID